MDMSDSEYRKYLKYKAKYLKRKQMMQDGGKYGAATAKELYRNTTGSNIPALNAKITKHNDQIKKLKESVTTLDKSITDCPTLPDIAKTELVKKIKSDIKGINRIVEKNRKNKELGEAIIKSIEADVKEHTDNFNRYHELDKKGQKRTWTEGAEFKLFLSGEPRLAVTSGEIVEEKGPNKSTFKFVPIAFVPSETADVEVKNLTQPEVKTAVTEGTKEGATEATKESPDPSKV